MFSTFPIRGKDRKAADEGDLVIGEWLFVRTVGTAGGMRCPLHRFPVVETVLVGERVSSLVSALTFELLSYQLLFVHDRWRLEM